MIRTIIVATTIITMLSVTYAPTTGALSVSAQVSTSVEDVEAKRKKLEEKLEKLEKEIAKQRSKLGNQRQQSQSIKREIERLKSEIRTTELEIKRKNTLIESLSGQISKKQETLRELSRELQREKASMAKLIRKTNEIDDFSLFEVLLSGKSISEFYADIDNFLTLEKSLQESADVIKHIQERTKKEKQELQEKKEQQANIKYELEQDREQVASKENQKQELLQVSKNKERTYKNIIENRKKQAAEIRAALFELAGDIKGGGIPFGDAYDYAKVASNETGVATDFLLAVWKQESNMGNNVGTCNRPQDSRKWRDIMPGPGESSWRNDEAAFLRITERLGISPEGQPLSCPIGNGWGGAMGPSQFIPTTWEDYAPRVEKQFDVDVANPWNPQHAIMATALYMKDLGAAQGTFSAEREAACKYYSGQSCYAPNVRNMFYGNAVLDHAKNIQQKINVLERV